jgi:fatty acyl-CoA reductase
MTQNSVQEFYKSKTIFITGASGFMGKVLVEKLLYSCSDLQQLILLMRPKKGKSPVQRVKEFALLPLFQRIISEKPQVMGKILVISGEVSEPKLGMSEKDLEYVVENTNVIFHVAASVQFNVPLRFSIFANLIATKEILEIAKMMKSLQAMVHVSTIFCNVEHDISEEIVYDDALHDPLEMIKLAKEMDEPSMAALEKSLIGQHPNNYSFTKRLAEILVKNEFESSELPVCIVRPSIVGSALREPFEGWIDSLTLINGLCLGFNKGVIRCMLADVEAMHHCIPVDMAVNGLIISAKQTGNAQKDSSQIPVYNSNMNGRNKEIYDAEMAIRSSHPHSKMFWYPNMTTTKCKYYYYYLTIILHWIPAYLVDLVLLIARKKTL